MSDEIEIIIPHKEVIKDLQSRLEIAEAQLKVAVEALDSYKHIWIGEKTNERRAKQFLQRLFSYDGTQTWQTRRIERV